jgi:cytochrome c oxidase cbb3-type subunit 3
VIWGLAYSVVYPAWPTLGSHTAGTRGYWSRGELAESIAEQKRQRAPMVSQIEKASLAEIRANEALRNFAIAGGRQVFADNCAPCHGPSGAGAKGYPILADDDWLWGGRLEQISETIRYGVRNAHDKSRTSLMPRFGDGMLSGAEIADVADHVLSLSGSGAASAAAARGARIYAEQCVACHGEKGEGNRELGAPKLSDRIWLNGGDRAAVIQQIAAPRLGSMPAWEGRLDSATIKMLTVFVHALGGGE